MTTSEYDALMRLVEQVMKSAEKLEQFAKEAMQNNDRIYSILDDNRHGAPDAVFSVARTNPTKESVQKNIQEALKKMRIGAAERELGKSPFHVIPSKAIPDDEIWMVEPVVHQGVVLNWKDEGKDK